MSVPPFVNKTENGMKKTIVSVAFILGVSVASVQAGNTSARMPGNTPQTSGDVEDMSGANNQFFDGAAKLGRLNDSSVSASGAANSPRISASGLDLSSIDKQANPCVDFYKYSCGKWEKPDTRPNQSTMGQIRDNNQAVLKTAMDSMLAKPKLSRTPDEQKMTDLYQTCMDTARKDKAGAAPLKPYLDAIDADFRSNADLAKIVARFHSTGLRNFVFKLEAMTDLWDTTKTSAILKQPELPLPDNAYYLEEKFADDLDAYVKFVAMQFMLAGDTPEKAAKEAMAAVSVEATMASLAKGSRLGKLPASALSEMTPLFDWKTYFAKVGAPVERMPEIMVSVDYMGMLNALIERASFPSWKSYIRWKVINSYGGNLSAEFRDSRFEFYSKHLYGEQPRPLWMGCLAQVGADMGEALGKKFVELAFPGNSKTAAKSMIEELQFSMRNAIGSADWMSAPTKKSAVEKLDLISEKIGYPDNWADYSSLNIKAGDPLGNSVRVGAYDLANEMSTVGKPVDRSKWDMVPQEVNAYYHGLENSINFPAGILQPSLYSAKSDNAVNYGAMGVVVGHEITHGFDDNGRSRDGHGEMVDWWTKADAAAFDKRAEGFSKLYADYLRKKYPTADADDAGKRATGELLADNGGLNLAYAAMKRAEAKQKTDLLDGYTPEQRFFLSYGQSWCDNKTEKANLTLIQSDEHPVNEFRVNGQLSTMGEFQQAFGCKQGDPMTAAVGLRAW